MSSQATELLPNPGFEGTYSTGVAPSWTAALIDTRSLSVCEEVAAGRSGKAQSIRVTKKLGGYAGLQQSFTTRINGTTGLIVGRNYEASLWIKADRRDMPFSIGVSDNTAWQPKTFVTSSHLAGHEWQRVVIRFRATDVGTDSGGTPLTQNGNISFYIRLWAEGQLIVDDASFRELGAADHDPAPGGNLIRNSSYEAGIDGWQGWNTQPSPVADATAPHGSQVLSLNGNGLSNSRLQSWAFPLPWGQTYTLSLWMRGSANTTVPVWVGRSATNLADVATAVAAQNFNVTTGWVRYSFSFTPPPLPRGRAFLIIDPPDVGTVFIDGVQLEAGNVVSSYAPRTPIEASLVIDRNSAVYSSGEAPSGQWIIANHGPPVSLPARRLVRDVADAEVAGSQASWSQSLPSGRTQVPVPLPSGGKLGAFRGEIELSGVVVADNTFVVLPTPPAPGISPPIGTHLDFTSSTLPRTGGAGWTKSWYLNWSNQETTAGVWNYPHSGYFDSWRNAGLKTLAVLGGPPTFRQNRPANPVSWGWYPPADLALAQDYARRVAQRFGDRVAAWELCNEPDVFLHNNGYTNGPDAYAAESLAYATGVREAIPTAEILVGSATVDRSPEIWIGAALTNERTNAAGQKLRDLVDGVSFHNYDADPAVTRRLAADIRAKLAEVANSTGLARLATLPIWDTEWSPIGHPVSFRKEEPRILRGLSGSSARQNAALTAIGILSRAGENVGVGFLYHSYGPNTISCSGDGYDILNEFDGRPRPTLPAQAVASTFLTGATNPERIEMAGVWCYRFARADGRVLHAIWTDLRQSAPATVQSPSDGEVFDFFGNKVGNTTAGTSLGVPFEPIYLLGPALGLQAAFNGRMIVAGDFTPATEDGTDFGLAEVNAPEVAVRRTFVIQNIGSSPLALPSGAVITGAHPQEWSIVSQLPASLSSGESASLVLQFQPTVLGSRTATVAISSSEGTLRFGIAGEGTPPRPELTVSPLQSGASAAPGDAPLNRIIQISNLGRGGLTWSASLPRYYVSEASDQAGGPTYTWYYPAEGFGTRINFRNSNDTGNVSNSSDRDDHMSEILDLGFEMPFYGQRHSRIRITTNGVLTFNTTFAFASYSNSALPSSRAPNQSVFVLWDDLYMVANTSQAYWFKPDADTFVVSWHDIAYYNNRSARQTFQVVLKRDGTITTQYATVAASPNTSTGFCIGIQNQNSTAQALLHSRTPNPPSNSHAVRFTPPPQAAPEGTFTPGAPASWATLGSLISGSLGANSAALLSVRFDATNLAPGSTYRTTLTLTTNDSAYPAVRIPLTLSILAPPPPRIPPAGLLGYWRMETLGGGASPDESGWTRHLTFAGNTSLNSQGKFGSALRADGAAPVSSGSGPATGAAFSFPSTTACTFSAWVYLEGEGGVSNARYPRVIEVPGMSLLLRRNSAEGTYGGVGFNAAFSGSTGDWRTDAGLMITGRWYHLAVTYDRSSPANAPEFYVDGILRPTTLINSASGTPATSSGTGWIGNRPDGQRPFHGRIDHVRIYGRLLSASEISALASDTGNALEGTLRGDWRRTHFGSTTESPASGDASDPDGDGVSNFLEYACGLNPNTADGIATAPTVEANRLRIRFSRVADPSLTYQVEAGDSLGTLLPIWSSSGSQNAEGTIFVSDVEDVGPGGSRFLRLRVSTP